MLSIGPLTLQSNIILAPLSGISDLPFRLINRRFGCELAFCEMINVRSLSYKSKRTRRMLATTPADQPLGVQLLGYEEEYLLRALEVLKKSCPFSLVDLNAACPAKKVVRRKEGARLLQDPKKVSSLLKLLVSRLDTPVTLKIRSGWDKNSLNAVEVALRAEDAGASAVFIHGRTKDQGYSGSVDYGIIRQVKSALSIPVIASGDLFSCAHIQRMYEQTGCDAVAVARGSLGNPWIFSGSTPERDEVIAVMREHLEESCAFHGERIGVVSFRKFFAWYTRGFRGIRPLRGSVSLIKTRLQMEEALSSLYLPDRPTSRNRKSEKKVSQ